MKALNDGKQMRSDWLIPLCSGEERIKIEGRKAHSTQKPEALLYRVILASSDPGDVVLDPFFGTGTTGAVAKRLHRKWIGIEQRKDYVEMAQMRIDGLQAEPYDETLFDVGDKRRREPRVPFSTLVENSFIKPGQTLYFKGDPSQSARVKPDGNLILDGFEGSIHQAGKHLMRGSPCNGWLHWYYEAEEGDLRPIDQIRQAFRSSNYTSD
jgi:modification methylase